MKTVPVIYRSEKEIDEELLIVSHGQQRIKKYSELLKEYEVLELHFPVLKGDRTDLNPIKKRNKEILSQTPLSPAILKTLKKIKEIATELYGPDSDKYRQLWEKADENVVKPTRILKGLKIEMARIINEGNVPKSINVRNEIVSIHNKPCSNLCEIEDESVSCIMTSPPYFHMRDFGIGDKQRGLEKEPEDFVNGLVSDFEDCKRVLKQDGSLWVNLGECVINGEYNLIPHQFALSMQKNGWILNDEILWIKSNPRFTETIRSVRAHEYIFHFVKNKQFFYDKSWLANITDPKNSISMGTGKKMASVLSTLDFRDSVLRTGANNMDELRKGCEKQGFHLTHTAGFPLTVPLIAILLTTRPGDLVLDVFSGTATTGEVALELGRRYVGYEINPEYIKGSIVRLGNFIQPEHIELENHQTIQLAA
jgi:site-specific DNA-methyltransferase (adenine-specific)